MEVSEWCFYPIYIALEVSGEGEIANDFVVLLSIGPLRRPGPGRWPAGRSPSDFFFFILFGE